MELYTTKKARVDDFINRAGCSKLSRFTALFVSKETDVNLDFTINRLFQLNKMNRLEVNYELECPHCARTAHTFELEKEIPFGEYFECPKCYQEFKIKEEHIWVTYDPNRKYFSEEFCENIGGGIGPEKKSTRMDKRNKVSAYKEHVETKNSHIFPKTYDLGALIIHSFVATFACLIAVTTLQGILQGRITVEGGGAIIVGCISAFGLSGNGAKKNSLALKYALGYSDTLLSLF